MLLQFAQALDIRAGGGGGTRPKTRMTMRNDVQFGTLFDDGDKDIRDSLAQGADKCRRLTLEHNGPRPARRNPNRPKLRAGQEAHLFIAIHSQDVDDLSEKSRLHHKYLGKRIDHGVAGADGRGRRHLNYFGKRIRS